MPHAVSSKAVNKTLNHPFFARMLKEGDRGFLGEIKIQRCSGDFLPDAFLGCHVLRTSNPHMPAFFDPQRAPFF